MEWSEPGRLSSLNCSAVFEVDPRRLRLIRGELATANTNGDASSSREFPLEISSNPFLGPLRSCSSHQVQLQSKLNPFFLISNDAHLIFKNGL